MIPDHPIDTKALRKLADAATPRPWEVDYMGDLVSAPEREKDRYGGHIFIGTATGDATAADEDIEFIIAARNTLPQLLDQLEQAEARIKAVREMHQPGRLGEVWGHSVSHPDDHPVCEHCTDPDADGFVSWPCPTICALDGDA